jgi:hypothetical protein
MKSLFKSKIRWQHRSNDPASPSGQPQPQPQQALGPPSPSPSSSPSSAAPLSVSTAATSSPSSPPSAAATPTGAGAAAGAGAAGEDYIASEEEFQMQLAMALSASSNSDCVGDLDGEQIRKAKLISLDRFAAHRDEGHTAESLSRRYWVSLPFGTIITASTCLVACEVLGSNRLCCFIQLSRLNVDQLAKYSSTVLR